MGDTVIVVDISKPAPAKTEWKLPDSATTIGSNASGTIQQLTFAQPGVYTLVMTAALGECADAVEKTITILDKDQQKAVKNALGYRENLLIGFKVSPNPAAGAFRAVVQLSDKADVKVRLLDFASNRLVETRQGRQQEGYEFEFDHPELPPGIYILTLEVGKEVKTVKMIKV